MQGNVGSIPGWGAKIPHAVWHSQKIQEKKKNKKAQSRALTWGTWVSTGDAVWAICVEGRESTQTAPWRLRTGRSLGKDSQSWGADSKPKERGSFPAVLSTGNLSPARFIQNS